MLRDDIARYTELSGNDGLHTPIGIIGAYLDGYEKGKADAQPERKSGKWKEKEVIHEEEAKTAIEEWQSCRCSVCGRYDTRPYMYYFLNPNYCSWCGAEMVKGEEE